MRAHIPAFYSSTMVGRLMHGIELAGVRMPELNAQHQKSEDNNGTLHVLDLS